ncbi:hypothetical protein PIB30_062448 [Stylosanthes scabra]|uniref:Uncharacterized protein n=1 Tax=Stylosanthes scabra TaxID=79078 RepID=A0ABU6RLZ5_9FABA|nr:hypothetical protein [Stylosanthes scabra]
MSEMKARIAQSTTVNMIDEHSKPQDSKADDDITPAVVIANELLKHCLIRLSHDNYPSVTSDSSHRASLKTLDDLHHGRPHRGLQQALRRHDFLTD